MLLFVNYISLFFFCSQLISTASSASTKANAFNHINFKYRHCIIRFHSMDKKKLHSVCYCWLLFFLLLTESHTNMYCILILFHFEAGRTNSKKDTLKPNASIHAYTHTHITSTNNIFEKLFWLQIQMLTML